jgi:hypothetical protein
VSSKIGWNGQKTTSTNCPFKDLRCSASFSIYLRNGVILSYLVAGRSRESSPGSEGGLDGVSKKEALSIIRYINCIV